MKTKNSQYDNSFKDKLKYQNIMVFPFVILSSNFLEKKYKSNTQGKYYLFYFHYFFKYKLKF